MKKPEGLGDVIKIITNILGFKTCEKCQDRQIYLNKIIPFKKMRLTDDQKDAIEYHLSTGTTKVTCKGLNEIRKNYDGVYTDSCFCTLTQRKAFVKDFSIWYEIEKNK